MGFALPHAYERASAKVVEEPDAFHKPEPEDDETVYYQRSGNNFAVVSAHGCIHAYFLPDDGIDYFNRQ
ncbi:hypothetical protein [Bifidobacterium apri]|uniref:Uncharacterized protein n=1 Tax=Bifidobacterium apri TaxID=1769423 RepID=A0A6A2VGW6_9BIFI|nr:hypothetical protein [Bifidobacterium apri]KAB8296594.1 hypothetical protein DSM100238_1357 [Bifidobacterium apri]